MPPAHSQAQANEPCDSSSGVGGTVSVAESVTDRDNQFVVVARGGVKFETGKTGREGKQLGCSLSAGASAWSALSDRNVKSNITVLSASEEFEVIDLLLWHVPVSTWHYQTSMNPSLDQAATREHTSGEAILDGQERGFEAPSARRIGPMAQNVHGIRKIWEYYFFASFFACLPAFVVSKPDDRNYRMVAGILTGK